VRDLLLLLYREEVWVDRDGVEHQIAAMEPRSTPHLPTPAHSGATVTFPVPLDGLTALGHPTARPAQGVTSTRRSSLGLPITLSKGFGRQPRWTASFGEGSYNACGITQTEAKQALSDRIDSALRNRNLRPAFAVDDDGGFIVAVPDIEGGVSVWRISDGTARSIWLCDRQPDEAIASVSHYTPIPRA
jgi:hypothetical protein